MTADGGPMFTRWPDGVSHADDKDRQRGVGSKTLKAK